MRRAGLSAAILALGLGACAHYAPAPPHPAQFVADLDARRLPEKPAGVAWTGADLLSAALTRNPQIVEARAKRLAALAAARAAKSPPGPSLTLTAEYANEAPHWGYSGAGDIPLDYGARRSVRITTANLQALQAFYDYGEAIWNVRTALEKARGDSIAANAELKLADESVAVRRERASRIERRVAAGQDARAVAIVARTDLIAAQRRRGAAIGRQGAAAADLAKALGVAPEAVRGMNLGTMGAPEIIMLTEIATWRRDAALSRGDVLRAVADYDIAENALRLEIANQYPAISLGPGYNYDHGVTKLPFSLSLALPPWDLNRRAIAQAEAARTAAGRSLELAQANALAAVDAAHAAFLTAWNDEGRTFSQDLPTVMGAERRAKASADAGETDRVDELAARGATLDVRLNLVDAQHAELSARADLQDALRRSFEPAETKVIETAMTQGGRAR